MPPISRKQWGAKYADGFRDRPMPITEYWLHHSVTLAPDLLPPFDDDDAAVRTLERIGQERFKGGISYTYPVTPVGRLYQGLSLNRQGAHTLGHNTVAAAFVLVGDYRKRKPSAAQIEAIARQMVEDHRAGRSTRHTLNGGHRQASKNVGTTECPGDAAIAAIPAINARANELWAAGYPSTPVPEEDDMQLSDQVTIYNPDGTTKERPTVAKLLRRMDYAYQQSIAIPQLVAGLAALSAQVQAYAQAAAGQPIDLEAVKAASKAGSEEALEDLLNARVNVDIDLGPDTEETP